MQTKQETQEITVRQELNQEQALKGVQVPRSNEKVQQKSEEVQPPNEQKPHVQQNEVKGQEPEKQEQKVNSGQQGEEQQAEEVYETESNWTDATESVAADDEMQFIEIDDELMNAMEFDSDQEGISEEDQEDEQDESGQKKPRRKKKKEQQIAFEELQEQFVKGGQSDEYYKMGSHQKFCISLGLNPDGKTLYSGGGDDQLLCYKQIQQGTWQQFYRLKHSQTVSRVEVSHDGKYVISLTDNEIYCTEIDKQQSLKLDIQNPSDVVCHKQGGVLAAAYDYSVSIYNLKGLELYTTYNLDQPPTSIAFSQNGKQIVAACQSKLRIITPKTGQIIKTTGPQFHNAQISTISTNGQLAVTGCIAGDVFITSLVKGNVLGRLEEFNGSINVIYLNDNQGLIAPQGDGVYWTDITKFKRIFHSPAEISVSAIIKVHSANHFAIADLQGNIHLVDNRDPMNIIAKLRAGNTVHALQSKGSQLYAACQDGQVRVFDIAKAF